ncbi:response regulator [uncultured Pseudokineococcus sp.]|uniref:response regulator n=1 Tax=uncultured Pseudokineococcus sp. TaxID=1642928 RepID=UPI002616607C|nr:response regulator [uncultured Pseudokineococcus sp.]
MTRALVVEDDRALARALAITLRASGYEVVTAATGAEGVAAAATAHPDVVVLDLGLPDMDGLDVLAAVRGWSAVPVLVLTARSTGDDAVEALDAGADDVVTKPFGMDVLLARLRAAVRRGPSEVAEPVVRTASFDVDLARRLVLRDGAPVRLTPTEWHLLELLARAPGRVVPQQLLLAELRGPHLRGDGHYLRVYVAQLRRKLERDPSRPRHLLTEPGVGYRLEV